MPGEVLQSQTKILFFNNTIQYLSHPSLPTTVFTLVIPTYPQLDHGKPIAQWKMVPSRPERSCPLPSSYLPASFGSHALVFSFD